MRWRRATVGGGAVAAALAVAPAAAAQAPPVSAYPSPGVVSASTHTQISLRGRPADALGAIEVRASRTGVHRGVLRPHSDGNGASLVLNRPFAQGERVRVRTDLPIANARDGDYVFRVARLPEHVRILTSGPLVERVPAGARRRPRSRPDLRPPVVTVEQRAPEASQDAILLGPKPKAQDAQAGPMILDGAGRLVYFRPLGGNVQATDVRVQRYRGQPVLTWWQGTSRQGIGRGELVVLDQSYRTVARIRAGNGLSADLHEFIITPRDTALFISYPIVSVLVDGRRRAVVDSVIQEVDIATGLVLFEWHSLGRIAVSESFVPLPASTRVPWDYVHANSVDEEPDGSLLMSARSTWAIYEIDRATGRLRWRLGGKRSDFRLGPGASFAWQHDARRRADGSLGLFDNSAAPPVRKRSRAISLVLDPAARTATLRSAVTHPRGLLSATQGNAQALAGGGQIVGWGSQRYFTEYAADGRLLFNARLAIGFESYRAHRAPWSGRPHTQPRAAAARRGAGMDVYASWNGATEVASWEVLAGASAAALAPVASAARGAFETRIPVAAAAAFVAVRARDRAGAVLGTSPARRVSA